MRGHRLRLTPAGGFVGVLAATLAATVGVTVASGTPGAPGGAPANAGGLTAFSDCPALLRYYQDTARPLVTAYGLLGLGAGGTASGGEAVAATASGPVPAAGARPAAAGINAVGSGPTGTNVQEPGVDEPDLAKVDGTRLVTLTASGRLAVLDLTGGTPRLTGSINLADQRGGLAPGVFPRELLLAGDRALVLSQSATFHPGPLPQPLPAVPAVPIPGRPLPVEPDGGVGDGAGPPAVVPFSTATDSSSHAPPGPAAGSRLIGPGPVAAERTRLTLMDLSGAVPRVERRLDLDGRYLSARLTDGVVRLALSTGPTGLAFSVPAAGGLAAEQQALEANRAVVDSSSAQDWLPHRRLTDRDGAVLATGPLLGCNAVARPAQPSGVRTLALLTLPLGGADPLAKVQATGVVADGDLVYASPDRFYVATSRWGAWRGAPTPAGQQPTTTIHAFDATGPDRTPYLASGDVPGYVYGRWAFSEYDGRLRVAVTTGDVWAPPGDAPSESSLVVLRQEGNRLVETGRVDGLGQGERVQAVRYFGDLATVVTFRQTDPLYTLDLSDPTRPRVAGQLKIPGFSAYLHPVGDSRLLGVGQDADPATGQTSGLQVSLFDLRDVAAPVRTGQVQFGPGYTPVEEDPRAFAYDVGRSLALLPAQFYGPTSSTAVVVAIAVRGDTVREAGRWAVGPESMPQRVLLAGDRAYAVAPGQVTALDLGAGLAVRGQVQLP